MSRRGGRGVAFCFPVLERLGETREVKSLEL